MNFDEKNGIKVNERMSEETKMSVVENLKTANNGVELSCEYRNFPVTFVNALRRLILSGVPTVTIQDIDILDNTTQMPHEMLRHRVEMLPVNVSPDDANTIRDAKIELRILPDTKAEKVRIITTDDFVVDSSRSKILMKDVDFDTPILFLRIRPGESLHLKARLGVESKKASQVCNCSTKWHIDPERAKVDKKTFVETGGDPLVFDNFYIQRSYSVNEQNRPNWIDMNLESIGVLPAKDILKYAVGILAHRLDNYMKEAVEKIVREREEGSYTISLDQGGHTIGALIQEVMYSDANVEFVGYDIPHPLKETMVVRFHTKKTPESRLKVAIETIKEYCAIVEKSL
jgi:DNA-directed RNA polymerase subunit L